MQTILKLWGENGKFSMITQNQIMVQGMKLSTIQKF